MTYTLEESIKFDHGLTIGQHLVCFKLGEKTRLALVDIGKRGKVLCFPKPNKGDMYTSWECIKGNKFVNIKLRLKIWAEKDVEFMSQFDGTPAATIQLPTEA